MLQYFAVFELMFFIYSQFALHFSYDLLVSTSIFLYL